MSISLKAANMAAKIDTRTRMDMVQRGYNPMNIEDVQRYYKKLEPLGLMKELVSYNLDDGVNINNMGEKKYSISQDMGAIKQAMAEGDHNIDPRHLEESGIQDEFDQAVQVDWGDIQDQPINNNNKFATHTTQQSLASKIDYTPKNVNEIISSKLGAKQPSSNAPIKTPVKIPVTKQYITESTEAHSLGYKKACVYLNAFTRLLKNPSEEGRNALIEAINNMVLTEEKIHPSIINVYRKGLNKAEQELYAKIKNLKK